MQTYNQEGTKKALAVLALAILLTLVWHVTSTVMFNNTVHTVKGADDKQPSYLAFGNREDSTSSWVKRDFDLYGKKVDLQANTIDGVFYNHSKENIVSRSMATVSSTTPGAGLWRSTRMSVRKVRRSRRWT